MSDNFDSDDHEHSCPHESEVHAKFDGMQLPPLDFRRPDELSDYHLMELMDRVGEQMLLRGLTRQQVIQARSLLYSVIDSMSQHSWSQAYEIKLWRAGDPEPLRLWNVVVEHVGYPVHRHRPDQAWEVLPTGGQVFYSVAMHLGAHRSPGTEF